jgi:hypothetical protein
MKSCGIDNEHVVVVVVVVIGGRSHCHGGGGGGVVVVVVRDEVNQHWRIRRCFPLCFPLPFLLHRRCSGAERPLERHGSGRTRRRAFELSRTKRVVYSVEMRERREEE